MIYQAYQTHTDLWAPVRAVADWTHALFRETYAGPLANPYFRNIAAGAELLARTKLVHDRPAFGIGTVSIAGENVPVHEDVAFATPFGALLHFRKARAVDAPRVLVVAPMAGHFATLLRDTVRTLLPEHDVYVTDWFNARDVAHSHGRFGLDEYIAHLVAFLEHLGPRTHVIGVCQPCAALLATVALLNEDGNPAAPPSMTLMAGPIDTRINPTRVNEFATGHDIAWFERNVIDVVPLRHEGARRRVYPGFMQLTAFLSMNLPRHLKAHGELYRNAARGLDARAQATRDFYDEYFSVLDLPAEFYLETVARVFQEHHLPRGRFVWRNRTVDPRAIRKTALFTVEGERDDVCAPGQTLAAQDLCSGMKPSRRKHHLQPGVGHYGVFAGHRWHKETYPLLRDFILRNA
jgi:poly(3-hydroxybutyrate) depolymerase